MESQSFICQQETKSGKLFKSRATQQSWAWSALKARKCQGRALCVPCVMCMHKKRPPASPHFWMQGFQSSFTPPSMNVPLNPRAHDWQYTHTALFILRFLCVHGVRVCLLHACVARRECCLPEPHILSSSLHFLLPLWLCSRRAPSLTSTSQTAYFRLS